MKKVVISILNYNSGNETLNCLKSIRELDVTGISISVYVLDNGSNEAFKLDEMAYKSLNLKFMRSNKNLGFTGGHNYIYNKVKEDEFDYFLLLNNDCVLEKKSLIKLVYGISGNVAGTVPKIYFSRGKEYHKSRYLKKDLGRVIWYAGGYFDWMNVESKHSGLDDVDNGQFEQKKYIDFATGACFLLKKEVIEEVGLFDDKYFLYYEDADLSMRILRKGYKLLYTPDALVWHDNASSSGTGSTLHDYYLTRNKLLFGMRYAPKKTKLFILKQGISLFFHGRKWQKIGARDYFIGKFGTGSYGN